MFGLYKLACIAPSDSIPAYFATPQKPRLFPEKYAPHLKSVLSGCSFHAKTPGFYEPFAQNRPGDQKPIRCPDHPVRPSASSVYPRGRARKRMQTGVETRTDTSVGVNAPPSWSIEKTLTLCPCWLATSSHLPDGSTLKLRGTLIPSP